MSILSIQSHVAYGYVGNKAAVYPLQNLGFDVWPVNTVQFSNHTGYGQWQGEIFSQSHIQQVIRGLIDLGVAAQCEAILSGYMGSAAICEEVSATVNKIKALNPHLLYLCDPVIGNNHCFVKPEVLEFFKTKLHADIITPNQFEAQTLTGIIIEKTEDLKKVADYFHGLGVKIVLITGLKLKDKMATSLSVFVSDQKQACLVETLEQISPTPLNGTGDVFSALYLGFYLKAQDAVAALQQAIYFTQQVIKATLASGNRELKILAVDYKAQITTKDLPVITRL